MKQSNVSCIKLVVNHNTSSEEEKCTIKNKKTPYLPFIQFEIQDSFRVKYRNKLYELASRMEGKIKVETIDIGDEPLRNTPEDTLANVFKDVMIMEGKKIGPREDINTDKVKLLGFIYLMYALDDVRVSPFLWEHLSVKKDLYRAKPYYPT